MGGEHLVLDPAIRNWVVFPLMLMVILVGVLRHYITALLKAEKPLEKEELTYNRAQPPLGATAAAESTYRERAIDVIPRLL
eukprot:g15299.t1